MLRVAIIDDGIPPRVTKEYPNIKVTHLVVNDNNIVVEQKFSKFLYYTSHAEVCFTLYANQMLDKQSFELISINIMEDKKPTGEVSKLIAALKWCAYNNINLINMSVGTTNYWEFTSIEELLQQLSERNTIIIAAHSNKNKLTYPASSKYVIGVRCDQTGTLAAGDYIVFDNGIFNTEIIVAPNFSIYAKKIKQPIDGFNSFAAPIITSKVHKGLIDACQNIYGIMDYLRNNSKKTNLDFWTNHQVDIKMEQIDIPIIALNSDNLEGINLINHLVYLFRQDKYVTFSIVTQNTKIEQGISIDNLLINCHNSILNGVYFTQYYTSADILFIYANKKVLRSLYQQNVVDIVLTNNAISNEECESIIYKDTSLETAKIVKDRIIKLLS